jgi:hypothetical protein
MLLVRDGFGGLGTFGAAYDPYAATGTPKPASQPYVPGTGHRAADLQAKYFAFLKQWGDEQIIEAHGLAAKLPPCPPNSLVGTPAQCYGGMAPNLLPPGSFTVYGVPFSVGEFRKGERFSFQKTVTPDVRQTQVIEYAIRKRSAQVFGKMLTAAFVGNTTGFRPDIISINQARAFVPQLRTEIRGLKFNPIPPHTTELEQAGGLYKWFARGGFPLIAGVANGTISLDEAYSPTFCQSILCRCPSAQYGHPVSCVRATVTKDGAISQHPGNDKGWYWVFFNVDASRGTIMVSLDYDEPSKLERVGNAMASVFKSIGDMLCMAAPVAKEQLTALTLTKCIDKDKKPCKQGATGCTCVAPPDSTAVAVGTTNMVMAKWCEGWSKQQAAPTDFPIDNILPAATPKPLPWAWIIGGLAVVGGVMYASRK